MPKLHSKGFGDRDFCRTVGGRLPPAFHGIPTPVVRVEEARCPTADRRCDPRIGRDYCGAAGYPWSATTAQPPAGQPPDRLPIPTYDEPQRAPLLRKDPSGGGRRCNGALPPPHRGSLRRLRPIGAKSITSRRVGSRIRHGRSIKCIHTKHRVLAVCNKVKVGCAYIRSQNYEGPPRLSVRAGTHTS